MGMDRKWQALHIGCTHGRGFLSAAGRHTVTAIGVVVAVGDCGKFVHLSVHYVRVLNLFGLSLFYAEK